MTKKKKIPPIPYKHTWYSDTSMKTTWPEFYLGITYINGFTSEQSGNNNLN